MVYFRDVRENGNSYLCVLPNPRAKPTSKNKLCVYKSLLRPDGSLNFVAMRTSFPKEMTTRIDPEKVRPFYVLRSTLKESVPGDGRLPMLGRRIIDGAARWGFNSLKMLGEFSFTPLYWEWTEDILARCASRLQTSNIYDAVCASLYTYDRNTHIIRAFCESWCPSTNTLHTEEGEWSISLWDLHKLGGLPISGHIYDETIPNFTQMEARDKDGGRLVSRALEHLFGAYCYLADQPEYSSGVLLTTWINFWCKRKSVYNKLPDKRIREANTPPKLTHNPSGEIPKDSLGWTPAMLDVFAKLDIENEGERRTTYLAAFLSCWLCLFVLPGNKRVIRPETFEVAVRMARGSTFSLAPAVLANIYRGLNTMTLSSTPSSSGSAFPAHYLYVWLAHYFGTHHQREEPRLGPLMIRYSGHQGDRSFTDVAARDLIHKASSFKASCLVHTKNICETIEENGALDESKLNYVISLRTAYLPIRERDGFFLEPYNPTRFSRQFGFYQAVPGILPQKTNDDPCSYNVALNHLRTLLFSGSHCTVTLPGYALNWTSYVTAEFRRWWGKVTISDLREQVQVLLGSVDYKRRKKGTDEAALPAQEQERIQPTPPEQAEKAFNVSMEKQLLSNHSSTDDHDANFKHKRKTPDARIGSACVEKEVSAPVRQPSFDSMQRSPLKVPRVHHTASSRSLDSEKTVSMQGMSPGIGSKAPNPPPSPSPTMMVNSIFEDAATLVEKRFLKGLKEAEFENVASTIGHAPQVYQSVQRLGGDPSALNAVVDVYWSKVQAFLDAKKQAMTRSEQEVSTAQTQFRSAKSTLEKELKKSKDLEKQLSEATQEQARLEALLEAQWKKASDLKASHDQQLEVVSAAESESNSFKRIVEELEAVPGARTNLDEMERNLKDYRASLDAAI